MPVESSAGRRSGKLNNSGNDVEVVHELAARLVFRNSWATDNERHLDRFLIRYRFAEAPVLAEQEAVVGCIDNDGVVELSGFLQRTDQCSNQVIDRLERLQLGAMACFDIFFRLAAGYGLCCTLLLAGRVEWKAYVLEGISMLRRGNGALALIVHRLCRDKHEERIRRATLVFDEANGARLQHVSGIVAGARTERLDPVVLVDVVVVVAGAGSGEGVPKVPAGGTQSSGLPIVGLVKLILR